MLVALEDARVLPLEHLLLDALLDDCIDLLLRRPQLGEHHRLSVRRFGERLGHKVLVHRPSQREGDHQRR